ncbi:hypothetical protein [Sphingomonas sp. SUN039]|uniref:hypothetical protein n=1 Tax=Sphingomonas sp. SUN039 TaxID=2937787 RepID=UPI002164B3F8|nr:hypothetical protein [Sphingomonas sp. SUN039]UVO55625.1 hypothetical protein M0209_16435 [Sphingomonas sp. SUN039]
MQSFDAFAEHVFADEALQAELAALRDPVAFVARMVERAAARGIVLDPAHFAPYFALDPLGLHRFRPPLVGGRGWPPRGWLPTGFFGGEGGTALSWLWFGPDPLRRPFFEMSEAEVRDLPFNRLFRYGMTLDDLVSAAPDAAPPPDGFVFHMSRCGSTLVARMLAAVDDQVVVSEPPILDAVVQFALAGQVSVATLRAIVLALTRDRSGTTRRRFVKLFHWHALALPLFRAAFPDVPCIFLCRDPVEVLVSQRRSPGYQPVMPVVAMTLPGEAVDADLHGERFAAWLLGRLGDAALDAVPPVRCIAYPALPEAVFDTILPHFGVEPTPTEAAVMRAATQHDAKTPDRGFTGDTGEKQREATDDLRALAGHYCGASWARLRERCAADTMGSVSP